MAFEKLTTDSRFTEFVSAVPLTASHRSNNSYLTELGSQSATTSAHISALTPTSVAALSTAAVRTALGASPEAGTAGVLDSKSLYPHLYDRDAGVSSRAIEHVIKASADLDDAVTDLRNADLQALWPRLVFIADSLYKANQYTQFNEAFGAVVLHCYRAIRSADPSTVSKDGLFVVKRTLERLLREPFINIAAAADLVDQLEESGWNVADPDIENFNVELLRAFGFASPADSEVQEITGDKKAQDALFS